MDCSLSSSSVHGISQARILELVATSFSRGASQPREGSIPVSCIAGGSFTTEPSGKPPLPANYVHLGNFLLSVWVFSFAKWGNNSNLMRINCYVQCPAQSLTQSRSTGNSYCYYPVVIHVNFLKAKHAFSCNSIVGFIILRTENIKARNIKVTKDWV